MLVGSKNYYLYTVELKVTNIELDKRCVHIFIRVLVLQRKKKAFQILNRKTLFLKAAISIPT